MALIIKNYNLDDELTTDLYVKINHFEGGPWRANGWLFNLAFWYTLDGRKSGKAYNFYDSDFLTKFYPVNHKFDNMMSIAYDQLKQHYEEQGYTVVDNSEEIQEQINLKEEKEREKLQG